VPTRGVRNFGFSSSGPPGLAPVTRILVILLVVASLVGTITQRKLGFGTQDLNFQVGRVLSGEVWRFVTYPFVETSPINLIISGVVLWLFGSWFESRWGQRDFLRFFAVATIGAALLAIPLSLLINMVLGSAMRDVGIAEGPGAALDAMLVAMALTNPDSNILFGFVLPMRARTVVFVLLGIQLIFGIQTGAAAFSITLGGMAMGYLLVTGRWRPARLWESVRKLGARRRRGLHVVPPRDHTLH
jgi:membrane associated rhomboid family serine protease